MKQHYAWVEAIMTTVIRKAETYALTWFRGAGHPYRLGLVLLLAAGAGAQTDADAPLGGYRAMEIEAGLMIGNFATGAIEEISGGVRIRLLSDDPELIPLPIEADRMTFTWTPGQTTPTTVIMERMVRVTHPDAAITAERAEWDFDSGVLIFSGNPEVSSEQLKGLRGEKMTLNMKTNRFEVTRMRADEVPLQTPAMAERAPRHGFTEQDIRDWPRLIGAIKDEAGADAPSPGRQILGQMSEQNQQLLLQLDVAVLVERKADMLRLINGVLTNPGIYDAAAWADAALPDEARELLAAPALDAQEQSRLNRLLIEAAYPFAFGNTQ